MVERVGEDTIDDREMAACARGGEGSDARAGRR